MLRRSLLLLLTCALTSCDICPKCNHNKAHGMQGIDCYGLDLRKIPPCFRSDIQVLDLSHNRIRKITKDDIVDYSNLKILYLDDNMIMNIEESSLKDKSKLEILNLSWNSLAKIPAVVFHLPSLSKLSLSHNDEMKDVIRDIEDLKPITSPLTYLDLSYNNLREFPDFGMLPTLNYLNITGNSRIKMEVKKFSGICKLEVLYNNNTSVDFDDPCECWRLQLWLEERNVDFTPFNCQKDIDCDNTISTNDTEIFKVCNETFAEIIWRSRLFIYILPISCIIIIIIIIIIVTVFLLKRRRRRRRKPRTKQTTSTTTKLIN